MFRPVTLAMSRGVCGPMPTQSPSSFVASTVLVVSTVSAFATSVPVSLAQPASSAADRAAAKVYFMDLVLPQVDHLTEIVLLNHITNRN